MSKKGNGIGKFVLGTAVGALAGVLFAPRKGEETRKMAKEKALDLLDKAKEIDVKEVRDEIESRVLSIIDELKDLDKEKALDIAKNKAKSLKKNALNLVDYTKEKATPKVQEAAEVLRKKAIEVTEGVLKKLEEK